MLPKEETSLACHEVASLEVEDLKHFCFLSAKVYAMFGLWWNNARSSNSQAEAFSSGLQVSECDV